MKKSWTIGLIYIFFVFSVKVSLAADKIDVRMIEASNQNEDISGQLVDVAGVLKSQLLFKSFQLIDRRSLSRPGNRVVHMARGYQLMVVGEQGNLTIHIARKHQDLLKTTVELKVGKPLIVGGFPTKKGKLIFVLLAM